MAYIDTPPGLKRRKIDKKQIDFAKIILQSLTDSKLTGSRRWGVNSWYSDIDIIINPENVKQLHTIANLYGYTLRPLCSGIFENDSYTGINIIQPSNLKDYKCWCETTDIISKLVKKEWVKDIIYNKSIRVPLFKVIKYCLKWRYKYGR